MKPLVHVVHCVDTEGPLYESLERTFERIRVIFGLDLPPSVECLRALQRQELPLGGIEADVARVLAPDLLDLFGTWDQIREVHKVLFSHEFRQTYADPLGQAWRINWFCCDHVGYSENPSNRDIGVHRIYDYYRDTINRTGHNDNIEFHFHPHPLNGNSTSNAMHWFANSTKLFEILAARIIDRQWFPAVNRPGFHTTRPDSHWFLEQFFPFDFANQAVAVNDEQADTAGGRYGDWRRAPRNWRPYHPSHDDYQVPGACRRAIFRCLNVGTRFRCLTQDDVDQAFAEADADGCSVLAFTDHDFRDQTPNIAAVHAMLGSATGRFAGVSWQTASAREAACAGLGIAPSEPFRLQLRMEANRLVVSSNLPTFGPQPFLALKSSDGRYFHDAFDIHEPFRSWSYTFDDHSLPLGKIDAIGVAANTRCGQTDVVTLRGSQIS